MEGRSLLTAALFLFIALFNVGTASAQNEAIDLETALTLDANEEASEYGTLVEQCEEFIEHPIDLNAATPTELTQLPFLSESDIRAILKFRYEYGRFQNLYELLLVPGLTQTYARMAMPYLTISPEAAPSVKRRPQQHHQLLMEGDRCLNTRAGYVNQSQEQIEQNKAYRGNPWHHKVRYQYTYGKTIRAGIIVEKDAGETYRQGAPWMGDSYNYYIDYRRTHGVVRQIIVGDFRASMGCGLLINQQFSIGKTMLSTQLMNRSASIAPQTSAEEYSYLEGVAAQLHFGDGWNVTAFLSSRSVDGIVADDTLTSITTTGYHRTLREEQRRHSARMNVGGLHAEWRNHWLDFGLNLLHTRFDKPYERTVRYYNEHWFRGDALTQCSAEYALHLNHFNMKGEVAMSDNGATATTHLIRFNPGERWQMQIIGRAFGKRYQQLHASTLSESSDIQAEQGLYFITTCNVAAHLDLTASVDYFRLTAPKYGIVAPSNGMETMLRADLKYTRWSASLRYRLKQKEATNSASVSSATLQGYFRHVGDLLLSYQPCNWMRLKSQVQSRLYSKEFVGTTFGFGVSQTLSLHADSWPISLNGQAAWFQTDDYNSRIYLTDLNLRYSYSSTMLYGLGVRYGASVAWHITPRCLLEGKYTLVNYGNRSSISSDLQMINGNTQQEVKVQLNWKI